MMIFSILKSFSGPQMDIFRGRNGKFTENIQFNSTYQIKLVSLKPNEIWLSYGLKTTETTDRSWGPPLPREYRRGVKQSRIFAILGNS